MVVGWYQQVGECLGGGAPVVSFEQGHEVLFGDVREDEAWRRAARQFDEVMQLPVPVAAVSPHVATLLQGRFGRRCAVWPNGIDLTRFHPEPRPPRRRASSWSATRACPSRASAPPSTRWSGPGGPAPASR